MVDNSKAQLSNIDGNGYYNISLEDKKLSNVHEENVLDKKNQHELNIKNIENKYELKKLNKELGWIGQCFGRAENSSKNITAVICLSLLIITLVASCILYSSNDEFTMTELWARVFPIITLSLGYLFGKNT